MTIKKLHQAITSDLQSLERQLQEARAEEQRVHDLCARIEGAIVALRGMATKTEPPKPQPDPPKNEEK